MPVLILESDGRYRADNTQLQDLAAGLAFRFSKEQNDEDSECWLPWGASVAGQKDGSGWIKCDVAKEASDMLTKVREESPELLLSKLKDNKSTLAMFIRSGDSLPGADGLWQSSRQAGLKTIKGKVICWRPGVEIPITWQSSTNFTVDQMGEQRRGILAGNQLVWDDGDVWKRTLPESFSKKSTIWTGTDLSSLRHPLAFSCHKGLKPESPNQDAWSVVRVQDQFSVYTVCDGHGPDGHNVADLAVDSLPRLLTQYPGFKSTYSKSSLLHSFQTTQRMVAVADSNCQLNAKTSGATATVVFHSHQENSLVVAFVGDSSAVVGRAVGPELEQLEALKLTRDHKVELDDERVRVQKTGAQVVFDGFNYRVYNKDGHGAGLNLTRSVGDLQSQFECGLTSDPELKEHKISDADRFLLICSDGVWTFIEPQQAVDIVAKFGPEKAQEAADCLAKAAWDEWFSRSGGTAADDITVLVVYLTHDAKGLPRASHGGA